MNYSNIQIDFIERTKDNLEYVKDKGVEEKNLKLSNILIKHNTIMKNLNLFNLKSIVRSKARWLLTLIAILTLGVGQVWGEYYYRGSDNASWGTGVTMTLSNDGFYYYRSIPKGTNPNFKIFSAANDWNTVVADGGKVIAEYNGTDFNSTYVGGSTGNNAWIWNDHAECYMLFYPSGTAINSTGSPIICASTYLPSGVPHFVAGTPAAMITNGTEWGTTDPDNQMTYNTSTSIYSKTTASLTAGTLYSFKVSTYNWGSSWNTAGTCHNLADSYPTVSDGNLTFKTKHNGVVIISFNSSNKILIDAPYQVSYAAGTGASGTVSASAITTYGSTCTLSSSTFSKPGYVQDGWATSDGGSKAYDLGATYTGGYTDVTLYPHWEPVWALYDNTTKLYDFTRESDTRYTLEITDDNLTSHHTQIHFKKDGTTFYEIGADDPFSMSVNLVSGGGMLNWSHQTTQMTLILTNDGGTWKLTATRKSYAVTLNSNGGTTDGSASVGYGATSLSSISAPTYTGHYIEGYYKEPSKTTLVADAGGNLQANVTDYTDANGKWIKTSATILYAKWGESAHTWSMWFWNSSTPGEEKIGDFSGSGPYTLYMQLTDANFNTLRFKDGSQYYIVGSGALTTQHDMVENPSGRFEWNTDARPAWYRVTITNSSGWKAQATRVYKVTYDGNGATGTAPTDANYYANAEVASIVSGHGTLEKAGYDFAGWTANSGGTGTVYTSDGTNKTYTVGSADVTLYAKWTKHNYTITYSPASAATGCTYTTTPTNADYQSTVNITITPDEWHYAEVSAAKAGGGSVTVTRDGNNFSFTQPAANVTVTVTLTDLHSNIFLPNEHNSWNTDDNTYEFKKVVNAANTATLSIDINKGDYSSNSYKFGGFNIYQSSWGTKWWHNSASGNTIMTSHNCTNWGFNTSDGDKNTSIDLPVSGTYTLTLTNTNSYANQKLSVTYPDKSFIEGAFATAWDEDAYPLIEDGTTQSVTIPITSPGDVQFRLVSHGKLYGTATKIEHSSNTQTLTGKTMSESGGTMTIAAYVAGDYTFTYNEDSKELEVTWPEVNQVRISAASPTDATNTGNYDLGAAVSNVRSVTRSLKANTTYTFKVVYNSDWYGYNSGTFTRSTSTSSNTLTTSTSGGHMTLTTDYAGNYTFKFNQSDKTLSVDFPEAYAVTHGEYAGTASLGSYTVSPSITTGQYVAAGEDVTFTATPNLGYKTEWYDNSGCTGVPIGTGNTYTISSIDDDKTVYAKFELMDIKINSDINGSHPTPWTQTIMTHSSGSPAIYTYSTTFLARATEDASAPYNSGYHFNFVDSNNELLYDYNGVQEPTSSGSSIDGVHKTADGNPTIQFGLTRKSYVTITLTLQAAPAKPTVSISADPIYTITIAKSGPDAGFASLSPSAGSTVEARASVASSEVNVEVNTGYTRTDWTATSGITITSASSNSTTVTATADGTLTANVRPNTYTVAFNANDDYYVGEATGTTAPIENKAYNAGSYTLTANGFSREGYTFAGWNTDPDGTSSTDYSNEQSITSPLTAVDGATVTLYAKWTGNEHTVSFNYGTGSGATASKDVTFGSAYGALPDVTAPSGCVFSGWFTAPTGGTLVEEETLVTTDNDHTLYARITQRDRVYFYNNLGWSDVYVTYDAYWVDGTYGAANNGKTYQHMTQIEGTDIWYADIPDAILRDWKYFVAFNEKNAGSAGLGTYNRFDDDKVVFRHDFDSYATMFVPESAKTDKWSKNEHDGKKAEYYSSSWTKDDAEGIHGENYRQNVGYWMRYNDIRSGYTITGSWDSWANSTALMAATPGETTFTMTKTLAANTTYEFLLYKEYTTNTFNHVFTDGNAGTMTSSSCTDWAFWSTRTKYSELESNHTKITTTVAGEYTFQLKTGTDGRLLVSVIYPLAVNDYRVTYSWTESATGKSHSSEIIKGEDEFEKKISVFVHSSSATGISGRTLQIEKCTAISGSGVPTWTSGNTIDISSVDESGVYNFVISKTSGNEPTGAFSEKYEGNYYIRTESSEGGWNYYKEHNDNIMTYSDYSMTQTLSDPYSHYYCRYIENTGMDITYQIATDYSPCVSDILVGDLTIGGVENKTLPSGHPANIRFTWNEKTNALRRAYLKSAQGGGNTRFLVLHGDNNIFDASTGEAIPANVGQSLAASELLFSDLGNWIYQVELQAFPSATVKLIAQYNDADRYLVGDAEKSMTIMGGTAASTKYAITAVYDFKTNRLMTVWTPGGPIGDALEDVDILLVRHKQEDATSVTFNGGSLTTKKVYGAIELRYDELVGHVANWTTTSRPLLKYMISFPFDVNISDIFGLNSRYGEAYIIQKYDGADRAARGFFRGDGTTTFWKDMEQNEVMRANVGYCVIFDNDYLNGDLGAIWENKSEGSSVYLYFPSAGNVGAISNSTKEITVTALPCTIDREFTVATRTLNHKYTDSNWNLIGVPIFQNSDGVTSSATITTSEDTGNQGESYGTFYYFYDYDVANNRYSIASAADYDFKTMYSYMLQYAGTVTFTGSTPSSVAARRIADTKKYEIELQVLRNDEEVINRTFVNLKENACDTFALNEDVYMSPNSAAVNIYTLAGNYDVAANVLSIDNHIVPVGVEVTKAGNYTFSMPSDFDGTVVLVDNFDGSRTDLSLGDYSVALPKGTIEDRFTLEINIERSSATDIEGIEGGTIKDGKAHKFIRDGIMYILRDGVIYDAMGKRVK